MNRMNATGGLFASKLDGLFDGVDVLVHVGQVQSLPRERERYVVAANARDRRLEVQKARLLHGGRDLCSESLARYIESGMGGRK